MTRPTIKEYHAAAIKTWHLHETNHLGLSYSDQWLADCRTRAHKLARKAARYATTPFEHRLAAECASIAGRMSAPLN